MTQGTAAARLRPEPAPRAAPPAAPPAPAAALEAAEPKETSAPLTLPLKSLAKDPSPQETSDSKLATALFNGPGVQKQKGACFLREFVDCCFEQLDGILSKTNNM